MFPPPPTKNKRKEHNEKHNRNIQQQPPPQHVKNHVQVCFAEKAKATLCSLLSDKMIKHARTHTHTHTYTHTYARTRAITTKKKCKNSSETTRRDNKNNNNDNKYNTNNNKMTQANPLRKREKGDIPAVALHLDWGHRTVTSPFTTWTEGTVPGAIGESVIL